MPEPAKFCILIVDDKERNIFALQQMLAQPDRSFVGATTGKEALKIILNERVDLIILDVQMPQMDGFEVAQIVKSNKRTRDIPIIFATAEKKEHHFVMKGFEEGAIDYLHKPLDKEVTEAKVAVLLQLYHQKKLLQEKNAALERYALLINNSADIICIINAATLRFEEVNDAVTALLGYAAREVRGTSLLFYLAKDCHATVQKFAKDGDDRFSCETQVYTKKRQVRWFNWNVIKKDGLWFANARDITETKEAQEIKNYLAAVVKQSNDAVYLHNPDGQIISWNEGATKIYGFTEAEALNMKVWNIVPEHLMQEAQALINSILKNKKVQAIETRRITKHGKMIDVVFSASLLFDSNNVLKSIAITERDITQQKLSEKEIQQLNADLNKKVEQLHEINSELEAFSYSISHDLRAPLRSINGYAAIIREEYGPVFDEEQTRLFSVIQQNARRMGALIDDLLEFSRLGRKEIRKSETNTAEVVREIVAEVVNQQQSAAQVEVKELLPVSGDYKLLYQVFYNLISNAVKYSSKKNNPRIEIGSYKENTTNVYYFKDNGAGFNMEFSSKLFGVFQRLHSPEQFEGTGVGLAIVQRIVAKHGGKVWAEAEVNKGATFYFSLPAL